MIDLILIAQVPDRSNPYSTSPW